MKRTLSLLLSLLMVFSLFTGLNISATAVEADTAETAAVAEVTESATESEPVESDLPTSDPEPETPAQKADLADTGAQPDLADTGASYDLWLGSVQVTDANKSDILGDGGKAQFDSSTNTLTLNNPTINGEHNYSKIFCNGFDLTVKGSYTMTSAQSDNALTVVDHDLTLDGNFTFLAWCYAVETSYDINVSGGRVTAKLEEGDSEACQAFCSDAGSITFGDNVEYFEAAVTSTWNTVYAVAYSTEGTVTLSSKLKLSTPEGGSFREGSCYYYVGGKQKRAKTVIIEPADPSDIKYDVWVGSTQVTGANKNNILGDGKVKYDPSTATLTLDNPTISTNYSSGGKTHKIYAAEDITVKGSYTMTSYAADYGIYGYMNLTLDGDFTILSGIHGVYARFTLTINGSLVGRANSTTYNSSAGIKASRIAFGTITRVEAEGKKVYGIYAERGLTIPPEYEVTTPSASYIENGTVVDNSTSSSTVAKRVVIKPVEGGLGVFLGEKQVTESNKNDIFGDGKASYDKDTKTLTINYPTIRGCYTNEFGETAVIYSKDDLTITGSYNSIDCSYNYGVYCEGDLTINADNFRIGGKTDAIYVEKDLTVSGYGDGILIAKANSSDPTYPYGINVTGALTIGTGLNDLEIEGDSCAVYYGSINITDDELSLTVPEGGIMKLHRIYESDDTTIAKRAVFSRAFKLWVGSTRVTEVNKNDVLGDGGKVKYNSKTHALTLSDPAIPGLHVYDLEGRSAKIYAEDIDLWVFGSYHMTAAEGNIALYTKNGAAMLSGDFTFSGARYGVVGMKDVTVSGSLNASGIEANALHSVNGDIRINSGSVTATSKEHNGMVAENGTITVGTSVESITVSTGDEENEGATAIWAMKDITVKGGDLTVSTVYDAGVYSKTGSIDITRGSLNISVSGVSLCALGDEGSVTIGSGVKSVYLKGCDGIRTKNDVTVNAKNVTVYSTGPANSQAIYSTAGSVTVGSSVDSLFIDTVMGGINAWTDIDISAANTTINIREINHGLLAVKGDVNIHRGNIKITGEPEATWSGIRGNNITIDSDVERIEIISSSGLDAGISAGLYTGLYAGNNITINGGTIIIDAVNTDVGKDFAIRCGAYYNTEGNLIIGKDVVSITAIGSDGGLAATGDVFIYGGEIDARSTVDGYGIVADGSIEILGGRVYAEGTNNGYPSDEIGYYGIASTFGDITFIGDIFVEAKGPDGPYHAKNVFRDYFLTIEELSPQHSIVYKDIKLWVGDTHVTTANMTDILGDGGSVSFDISTKTLTLNSPTITTVSTFDNGGGSSTAVIRSGVDLTVKGSYEAPLSLSADYGIFVQGNVALDGELTILGQLTGVKASGSLSVTGGNVKIYGMDTSHRNYAVSVAKLIVGSGADSFAVSGGVFARAGIEIASPLSITKPSGAKLGDDTITESNGSTTAWTVEIARTEPVAEYALWVGSTRVTSANRNDILSDGGKAKFDPSTNTLTLNDPKISGYHKDFFDHDNLIYADGFDLTIKGSFKMTSAMPTDDERNTVVQVDGGDLTLDGDFSFYAYHHGIDVVDLTVKSGSLIVDAKDIGKYYGVHCVGTLTVCADVDYIEINAAVIAKSGYSIAEPLSVTEPEGYTIDSFGSICGSDENVVYRVVIEGPAAYTLLGDVDGDGLVTVLDVTAIQKRLADLATAFDPSAADTDGDGVVTIIDATAIQRHLASLPTNKNIGQPIV